MKYTFITGIPASGKSYLAAKIAKAIDVQHIKIDDLREEMVNDPELKKWVDFYWNKDEKKYWDSTSYDQQWEDLNNQSEAFWPTVLKRIKDVQKSGKGAIFEGVNILPHLASRDLNFPGIVLLGESFEKILERNKRDPRWGKTEDLQLKEAEAFWNCERPRYRQEAEKYGFKAFVNSVAAEKELITIMGFYE